MSSLALWMGNNKSQKLEKIGKNKSQEETTVFHGRQKLTSAMKQRPEKWWYTVKKKACNAHQIWCATFVPSGTPYMAWNNANF